MKKLFNYTPFLLLLFSIIIVGCRTTNDETTTTNENNLFSTNSSGLSIGEIHNELLTYTYDQYAFSEDFNSVDEALIDLANFQSDYLGNFTNQTIDMNYAQSNMLDVRNYYIQDNTKDIFLNGMEINGEHYTLEEMTGYLYENGAISQIDKNIVNEIVNALHQNWNGTLSYEELYNELLNHRENWIASQGNTTNKGGDYSFIVLDIGINSLEWWGANSGASTLQKAIPVWLATDIVGAIGGAGFAAVSQHVFNNGKINWKIVAAAGLTTAVTASAGVFGKVGKWLSSL